MISDAYFGNPILLEKGFLQGYDVYIGDIALVDFHDWIIKKEDLWSCEKCKLNLSFREAGFYCGGQKLKQASLCLYDLPKKQPKSINCAERLMQQICG